MSPHRRLHPVLKPRFPLPPWRRITVELILEKLASGETWEQIIEAHPRLNREAIQAALAFAAQALRADVIYQIWCDRIF